MPVEQSQGYKNLENACKQGMARIDRFTPLSDIDHSGVTQDELNQLINKYPEVRDELERITPSPAKTNRTKSTGSYPGGSAQGAIEHYKNTIGKLNSRPQVNTTPTAPTQTPEAPADTTKKIGLTIILQ